MIFFTALGDEDRTKLAEVMIPEATIFVHDRMDPDNARLVIIPVEDHIARWAQGTGNVSEDMIYSTILVDGDMAQVWGPYRFMVEGETSHCGINSLSMVKTEDGWKVGNTSFTMVPPNECERLAAPEAPGLG